jgi:hypothetical protein
MWLAIAVFRDYAPQLTDYSKHSEMPKDSEAKASCLWFDTLANR